jgi:hypothetical protein
VRTSIGPRHEVQTRPLRDPARLRRAVDLACRRLTITPEQLWQELEANSHLADMELGAVSVKVLREVAMTLAAIRAKNVSCQTAADVMQNLLLD